jgi:hypothetical protein
MIYRYATCHCGASRIASDVDETTVCDECGRVGQFVPDDIDDYYRDRSRHNDCEDDARRDAREAAKEAADE